jgi:DNA-binding IclR family transcriptional regulator
MAALEEQPFSSMRDLSKRTFIPLSTVHQWLTNFIDFIMKHLH